ncbi:peptidylprolyl isomerase [Novosphingobium sp. Gsoil 351]|uniref:peptidylprolyl isomerase n=1 Tax=Novosphingobium sp. Gsoil 351 TaxID=2675225 RepID=UPI0012B473BB|nr:peptidylprolyl isomerase [Novosphingobium sp. Gsoil 351]QGN55779.1 peptidylprolyl isomerase [Novosphingobium sp. Gsoil 351]
MNRRFALIAIPLLFALPAYAAAPKAKPKPRAAAPAPPPPLGDSVRVAMVTELGTIELELDHKHAPVTVANFVRYVDLKRFDGIAFYRSMKLTWGQQPNGLIQAGLQGNPLKVMKPIAHEPTSTTGILHKAGAISMARNAPGTATADWSILLSDLTSLDADPKSPDPEAQAGYAAFGHVVSGMDVARKIWDAPLSPTAGEGALKGQMLAPPVKILTVRRVALPAP